ncbi:MAG: (Fe-S)-binding protein [Salinivirgaceae bacterium]
MYFDPFVLPFTIAMALLLIYLLGKYGWWIWKLDTSDQRKIRKNFFTTKTLLAVREIFGEGLLHRKIFKVNPRLGYMHMSLAFGWFLLIVVGAIEAHTFVKGSAPIYFPIFFRFFVPEQHSFFFSDGFTQLMDLLLLFVFSGLFLAVLKRFNSKAVGMSRTSRKKPIDRVVLTSLWLIFPLRLLAESFTSGFYHSGGFLTGSLGAFLDAILPLEHLIYPAWWAYSLALAGFFLGLPFTRYMHIPTEMVLIFFRNWGIKLKTDNPVLLEVEINSCPKCGICIDTCQLNSMAGIHDTQAVYFIQKLRNHEQYQKVAESCLMCGRCENVCPVSIDLNSIRLMHRHDNTPKEQENFGFIPVQNQTTEVIYFAGCMTHLTPNIKNSMVKILEASGDKFWFMDEEKGACCGRPLKLAGQLQAANELEERNREMMMQSGAHTLVTSCPICYKTFANDYHMNMEVLHHSEYIERLMQQKRLPVEKLDVTAVFHDPCELGRGSDIYEQPRNVLKSVAHIVESPQNRQDGLCCGGSLAHLTLSLDKKKQIAKNTLSVLTVDNPQVIATGCPLCKKSLANESTTKVMDIAELVAKAMVAKPVKERVVRQKVPVYI